VRGSAGIANVGTCVAVGMLLALDRLVAAIRRALALPPGATRW
jgi:hypothetical protein